MDELNLRAVESEVVRVGLEGMYEVYTRIVETKGSATPPSVFLMRGRVLVALERYTEAEKDFAVARAVPGPVQMAAAVEHMLLQRRMGQNVSERPGSLDELNARAVKDIVTWYLQQNRSNPQHRRTNSLLTELAVLSWGQWCLAHRIDILGVQMESIAEWVSSSEAAALRQTPEGLLAIIHDFYEALLAEKFVPFQPMPEELISPLARGELALPGQFKTPEERLDAEIEKARSLPHPGHARAATASLESWRDWCRSRNLPLIQATTDDVVNWLVAVAAEPLRVSASVRHFWLARVDRFYEEVLHHTLIGSDRQRGILRKAEAIVAKAAQAPGSVEASSKDVMM